MESQITIAGHPEVRIEHSRRLEAAILGAPWAERAVELGRGVLGDPDADPVTATLAAAERFATPSRRGAMWDGKWENSRLADGTPRYANAVAFAAGCRLGLDHGLRLRDMILDIARPEVLVDFGAGTGASLVSWTGVVDSLWAIEPADHFRAFGQAVVPEAQWFATTEDAPALAVEGGVAAIVFCHVLNVSTLWQEDLAAAVGLVADAEEILVATASNSVRSSRIARAERWLTEKLEARGFVLGWPREHATLPAGWGEHWLDVARWCRA